MSLAYQVPLHRAGVSELHSHSYLLKLCCLTFDQLLEARYLLEGVGLIYTFEKKDEKNGHYYEYEIIPPLTPTKFFQSDVLSVTLYNRLGKERYLAVKTWLTEDKNLDAEEKECQTVNITRSFQEVFHSLSPTELARAAELPQEAVAPVVQIDERLHEGKYPEWSADDDDFSMLKLRLSSIVDDKVWTPELKRELREIRFLYQLDDWDLLRALQNPYVTRHGRIDLERLRSYIKSEYRLRFGGPPIVTRKKNLAPDPQTPSHPSQSVPVHQEKSLTEEEKHFQQLAQISPLELLSYYHKGSRIPDSDVELVDTLIRHYALPYGVINVLLEYVLLKYDYKLPRKLVEKIAGQWKRLGIQTVEEALEQARKEAWEPKKKKARAKTLLKPEKLPQALKMQMERDSTQTGEPEKREDMEEKQAQIRAKLRLMNERFSARKERENAP
jgi:replication initiation and membrane attachment protein